MTACIIFKPLDSSAQHSSQGAYPPSSTQDDELAAEVCPHNLSVGLIQKAWIRLFRKAQEICLNSWIWFDFDHDQFDE